METKAMTNPPWWTIDDRVTHPEHPGQHGTIIELDDNAHRARVRWDFRAPRTWVSWYSLKLSSEPPAGNNTAIDDQSTVK